MNNNTTKNSNIPKLRFPEFDGEWETKKLGDIANVYDGTHQTPTYVDQGVKFVSVENIQDIKNTNKYITKEAFENDYKIKPQKGDILMTRITAGIIGATSIVESDDPLGYYVSLALIRVKNKMNIKFLSQRIESNEFKNELHKRIIHVAFPKKINLGDISDCYLSFPALPEQTRIASFFTTIDEKISKLKRKKSLLEQYKKGVMQHLFCQNHGLDGLNDNTDFKSINSGNYDNLRFSQKNEIDELNEDTDSKSVKSRNPFNLRFRQNDGTDFPNWERKKLGEVVEKKSSNISANKIEDNFGEYIIYGASGILKKIDFYEEENDYVSIIKDGAGVGRIFYCKGKSSVLGTMEIIKPKIHLNTYFMFCLLENIDFTKYITGSTIPHIYFKDYKNEECVIPSIEEQTKIANFLSALDDKIKQTENQIQQIQEWKKGLLQKMFC